MLQPDFAQQQKLLFCKVRIEQGKRDAMKSEVPRGEPRVFPFVRHRYDVSSNEMTPISVAALLAALRRRRLERITLQPLADVEIIKLLVPKHAGKSLALDATHIRIGDVFLQGGIEGIRFRDALNEDFIETEKGISVLGAGPQPDADRRTAPSRNRSQVKTRYLGTWAGRVYRIGAVVHDVFVERILEVAVPRTGPKQPRKVRLVLGEQQAIRRVECDAVGAEFVVDCEHQALALLLQGRLLDSRRPAPGISKPGLRQHVNARLFGAAIMDGNAYEHIVRVRLRVLHFDIEVAVIVKNAGIDQLEFHRP